MPVLEKHMYLTKNRRYISSLALKSISKFYPQNSQPLRMYGLTKPLATSAKAASWSPYRSNSTNGVSPSQRSDFTSWRIDDEGFDADLAADLWSY